MGEFRNPIHTLGSATEENFHPQPFAMTRLVNGLRRRWRVTRPYQWGSIFWGHRTCQVWDGSELLWTAKLLQPPQWWHMVRCQAERKGCSEPLWAVSAGRRGRTPHLPPAPSQSPWETRTMRGGWMLPFPATSTHKQSFSSAEHN